MVHLIKKNLGLPLEVFAEWTEIASGQEYRRESTARVS